MTHTTACQLCGFTVIAASDDEMKKGMAAHLCASRYRIPIRRA